MAQRQTPDRPDEQQHQGQGVDNPLPQQRQVREGQQSGDQAGAQQLEWQFRWRELMEPTRSVEAAEVLSQANQINSRQIGSQQKRME